jgi:hypothetical protein
LHGFVAVGIDGTALHYHARASLHHRAGHGFAIGREELRHTQLDSENAIHSHAIRSLNSCPPLNIQRKIR